MSSKNDFTNSRRNFLGSTFFLTSGMVFSGFPSVAGSENSWKRNPPLPFPHFPSSLHAFVWRNWNLVPQERMAEVLGTNPNEILELGKAMGLDEPLVVSAEQWSRSYITIIRRNWHLLPKSQLKDLLGWTEDHLEFILQEDDFLYIKLGSLKPDCEALTWDIRTTQAEEAEKWIQNVLKEEFSSPVLGQKEELFHFVKALSVMPAQKEKPLESGFSPRYGYGYFTLFGDPLLDSKLDPFPEGYLERMASSGLDGTWMHIVLSKLTPFPWDPAVSKGWEQRLVNLKKLVAKCRRHGIGIYLYLNEPRYMPLSFYERYPHFRGVTRGESASLCTSVPEVQEYLVEAIAHIVSVVPDLAGFFSITASENPTNCWSHYQGADCPRCGSRGPEQVIAELTTLYEKGIRQGIVQYNIINKINYDGTGPSLIAWDWGWQDGWADKLLPNLPKNTALMSVSEWDLEIERGGIAGKVGEYSISAVGPGPRAKRHWALARKHNLKIIAKIQAGTTWECGGVPYVPALENVAQHAVNLREEKVGGLMTGWTLGGYPGSPNLEVVSVVGSDPNISVKEALDQVAQRRYGSAASAVVEAWYGFSAAFREFPYHIGVVYNAPVHSGPANLLWKKPTGYSATMVGIGYDDLKKWRSIYPEEVFISQLYKVADGFESAIKALRLETADLSLDTDQSDELNGEMRIAEAVAVLYRSVANQADFIRKRDLLSRETDPESRQRLKKKLEELLRSEIALAKKLYELQSMDSRIGFEASNHYFYIPDDLKEKVLNCRYLLEKWLSGI